MLFFSTAGDARRAFSVWTNLERLEDRMVPSTSAAYTSLTFLRDMDDQFNTRLPVSDDVSSAGNHFLSVAKIPSASAPVSVNGSSIVNPHSGATSIENQFTIVNGQPFGGIYFQNGLLGQDGKTQTNFGETPNAGVSIVGATKLTFWARGQAGGEQIEFFAFGVGRDPSTGLPINGTVTPDSSARTPALGTITTLTSGWQQYSIDLTGKDTSYVLGGFAWVATAANNPAGADFFLDDIQYEFTNAGEQARLDEPRFLNSYLTGPNQSVPGPAADFDFILRNSAFAYDNALAILAFLADRDLTTQADSLRRAKLIGDAFVSAATHDRKYNDGRVRSDYTGGDASIPPGWVANGRLNTVPVAGFYDETQQTFFEILQLNVDTGNNAWVMISLLALYERTGESAYLSAARRIGDFIHTLRQDTGTYQGFIAGIDNADNSTLSPTNRAYASTEHNIDVYAAFTRMYQITGETKWQDDAEHAWQFVEAMWNPTTGLYRAGTTDPNTLNTSPDQVPLDVQVWATLANPKVLHLHPDLLSTVQQTFGVVEKGIAGYDFNNDKDGVWPEGTGQAGVAFAFAGDPTSAASIHQNLDQIRLTADSPGTPDLAFHLGQSASQTIHLGMPAALHDGLTTGFQTETGDPFLYNDRLHIGATAWNVFAQLEFNPYFQTYAGQPLAVSGTPDGSAVLIAPTDGSYANTPFAAIAPFGTIATDIRVATADVNGDRIPDFIFVTGPGTPIRVAVVSGADNKTLLVAPFDPFSGNFTGGGFVAAADIDNDGRAEFVVTPDRGGGPRVSIFSLLADSVVARVNFFGIDDPDFRGGARAALGDVNDDGTPDLAVSAGFLGGPRTAIFDGNTLLGSTPARLVNDFFAFPGTDSQTLRNGVFVTIGDMNGDGFADLAFGGGPGGAPRVFILSGQTVSSGSVGSAQDHPLANFFVAGNTSDRGGVRVAAINVDRDEREDLAVGSGEGSLGNVRVYLGKNFNSVSEPATFQDLNPFPSAVLTDGVFVG